MRPILFLFTVVAILSCSGTANSKQLSGADSVIINFNDRQTRFITHTVNTTETKAIKKLKQFVGGKEAKEYKCGYDGNIQFYGKGTLLGDFSFNYQEGCNHFIQLKDNKLSSIAMSNEAADFLKSLAGGKSWY